MDDWLTPKEAAGLLGVSRDTAVRLVDRGELVAKDVCAGAKNRYLLISAESLRRYADKRIVVR